MSTDHFKLGQADARAYYASQAYSSLSDYVEPEDAIRLFWPPVGEAQLMVSTPLPKPRQEWIAGFRKEQMLILAEGVVARRQARLMSAT